MLKISKTKKDYQVYFSGYRIKVPAGSRVTNQTACGYDDNYHFLLDYEKIAEELTGCKNSMLCRDLKYHRLNIPKDYCIEYEKG